MGGLSAPIVLHSENLRAVELKIPANDCTDLCWVQNVTSFLNTAAIISLLLWVCLKSQLKTVEILNGVHLQAT